MTRPPAPEPPDRGIDRLLWVVARLRGDDGCPWDREQTLDSLKPYLIEECYEVLDALDSGDPAAHAEELGDVLLQVALHARLREEEGVFGFDDVAHRIADKLVYRHPHVFGDGTAANSAEVLANWEQLKAREKGDSGEHPRSVTDGLPRHLPALQTAQKLQEKVKRVGFDWPDVVPVLDKVKEELAETAEALEDGEPDRVREEVGDLLFAVVNLARFVGVDAEQALRGTVAKFAARFRAVEQRVRDSGRTLQTCGLDELEAHWQAVKNGEPTPSRSAH